MKNTLAENMLRFGVKNLQETDIENIEQLIEQTSSDTNISTRVSVVGATPSNTSTINAANELKKSGRIINGTVTEQTALTKAAGDNGNRWNVTPKTLSAKHYIIIGNKKIIGDGGVPASITISMKDFLNNPVEAAGNGIFAIGRVLNAVKEGKIITWGSSKVVIGLNLSTPDAFVFTINLNEQDPIRSFAGDAVASLIALNVIKDDKTFQDTQELRLGRDFKQTGAGTLLNGGAIPRVPPGDRANLKQIDPIDTSNFQLKNSNINYKERPSEVMKAANQFINQYWPVFAKTYVTRLKSWVNSQAAKVNIDPNSYASVNAAIDQWITKQPIQEVRDQVSFLIGLLVKPFEMKPGSAKAAVSGTKTKKGKEGSLSQK